MSWPVDFGYRVEAKGETAPLFKQVHGAILVDIPDVNDAARRRGDPPEADGALTTDPALRLDVFTADCLPLLFFGPEPAAPIAAVHCGWRGALAGIAGAAVRRLAPHTASLFVAIEPAILRCCFEVKEDFVSAFRDAGRPIDRYLAREDGRWRCDLLAFVRREELGALPDSQIVLRDLRCTVCSAPTLPSYRRDRGTDPRLRSWIRKAGPRPAT